MQIEHCLDPLGWAAVAGFLLGLCWGAIYVLGWVWAGSWAWIDDAEMPEQNPVIRKVMFWMGWKDAGEFSAWEYMKSDGKSDGAIAFFLPLLVLALGPTAMLLAVALYPVTIGLACLYLIARLARFARRHKKLFDKHVKDPDAHRE